MMKRRRIVGMMVKCVPVVLLLVAVLSASVSAAPVTQEIKMDYFGYRPNDTKIAIFTTDPGGTVEVRDTSDTVVYTVPTDGGSITSMGADDQPTGDSVWQVDFSGFTTPGSYRLYVPSWGEQSYDFDLADDVYNDAGRVSLKTYYYQRCGVAHPGPYADEGYRDPYICHGYLTECTAAGGEPDYGTLDLSGGWHDAGDYNKYVWGDLYLAMRMLMTAYEINPSAWCDAQLGIPESGNGVPDILDEIKVSIDFLLKMQMSDGAVLSRVWDDYAGADDPCPPSNAVNPHHYYGPDVDSGGIFVGSLAMFARICQDLGDPYGNVATLKAEALETWNNYLLGAGDSATKCWAAAELYRLDQSITSAKNYVEGYYDNWAEAFQEAYQAHTSAALAYIQTPGADPAIVADMKTSIGLTVDEYFDNRGPYRNSLRDAYYHWGSNKCRGSWGVLLLEAAELGATGSHTAEECRDLAQDYLHAFHGQNPMRMVYLTNMAAYGGEHSSFQMFHGWFGTWGDPESNAWYIGLPPGVDEPDFPYFKGVDNYGISDDNYSDYGPLPGLVVGGPNKDYGGRADPPASETYYERVYRDWTSDAPDGWYRTKVWELTENSISYQAPYVALAAGFMAEGVPQEIDTDPPAAPTGLTATAVSPSRIDLDWDDNTENDLFCYNVYRSITAGEPYELVEANVELSAYSDSGLEDDTTYYYVVTAVDTSGNESADSAEASATTPSAVGTMHVGSISAGGQKGQDPGWWIDVYIVDHTDIGVADATVTVTFDGYDNETSSWLNDTQSGVTGSDGGVRFTSSVDHGEVCVDDVTHATLTYDPGQNALTCKDLDSAGAPPQDTTPPAAPTNLTATAVSPSQIDLDWDDNTESDLDSYNVYRDTVQIATDVTASQYSDTGLSASTQYCYTVTAVDTSQNESAESNQACATTHEADTTPPAAPTNLTATAVSAGQIDLDWDDNTEPDLDSYNVYRDTVQIATDVTASQYSDTGLSASTQYCYTVTAVDTSNNESAESNQACATTQESAGTMHVDSITVTIVEVNPVQSKARAEVVILDDAGVAVEGATVTGTFSGDISGSGSDATDANGLAVIESANAKGVTSVTFCVDDVTHATLIYNSADNVETCDSN